MQLLWTLFRFCESLMALYRSVPVLNQARDRLQRAIGGFRQQLSTVPGDSAYFRTIDDEISGLNRQLKTIENGVMRAAVFGLVSRGKSALINALVGRDELETGPINGVTRSPQSLHWQPEDSELALELIDTPGLDEVEGEARATMAQTVAQQADLILFVVTGDVTRKEYQAIRDLWQFQKPLLLVFNKVDLYPPPNRAQILENLRRYFQDDPLMEAGAELQRQDVVQVAAAPAPMMVQTQYPDGSVTQTQETPPPQLDELRDRLIELIDQEGANLLALNALVQTREAEQRIAQQMLVARQVAADELIRRYARNKAIAVGLNPVAVLDMVGGAVSDLALIRALAKLYGLPMTSHQAGKLLRKILLSSGTLLLGELGNGLFFGIGKGVAVGGDVAAGVMGYASVAVAQGAVAGYGSHVVGRAAQVYLEQGCTWGETGASTLIRAILQDVDKQSILYRLRLELQEVVPLT